MKEHDDRYVAVVQKHTLDGASTRMDGDTTLL